MESILGIDLIYANIIQHLNIVNLVYLHSTNKTIKKYVEQNMDLFRGDKIQIKYCHNICNVSFQNKGISIFNKPYYILASDIREIPYLRNYNYSSLKNIILMRKHTSFAIDFVDNKLEYINYNYSGNNLRVIYKVNNVTIEITIFNSKHYDIKIIDGNIIDNFDIIRDLIK